MHGLIAIDRWNYDMVIRDKNEVMQDATLQLLVFQLAFQLLGLADFADGPVEVILADRIPVVFDRKQTTVQNVRYDQKGKRKKLTYASVTTFRRSAPLRPSLIFTTLSKSMSPSILTVLV